jgi:hypothetical protein
MRSPTAPEIIRALETGGVISFVSYSVEVLSVELLVTFNLYVYRDRKQKLELDVIMHGARSHQILSSKSIVAQKQ